MRSASTFSHEDTQGHIYQGHKRDCHNLMLRSKVDHSSFSCFNSFLKTICYEIAKGLPERESFSLLSL